MTNNNILTPNSEYWKDNAIETFKGNSDLFVDFLQERDRHSAWIETQITDVQFEAMFAEPMYIADDAKKYSIPAEIVQEAANNSKLYGVVRGKHIPVGLAATESLIGYSKLIREGYSWMRRVNPVNLAKAINNGIDTIRYDDRRSTMHASHCFSVLHQDFRNPMYLQDRRRFQIPDIQNLLLLLPAQFCPSSFPLCNPHILLCIF